MPGVELEGREGRAGKGGRCHGYGGRVMRSSPHRVTAKVRPDNNKGHADARATQRLIRKRRGPCTFPACTTRRTLPPFTNIASLHTLFHTRTNTRKDICTYANCRAFSQINKHVYIK